MERKKTRSKTEEEGKMAEYRFGGGPLCKGVFSKESWLNDCGEAEPIESTRTPKAVRQRDLNQAHSGENADDGPSRTGMVTGKKEKKPKERVGFGVWQRGRYVGARGAVKGGVKGYRKDLESRRRNC